MSVIEQETTLHNTVEVVSFMACGSRFAIEAGQVKALLSKGEAEDPIPFAYLVGLVDEKTPDSNADRALIVELAQGDYAIGVSEPVELCRLPIASIHPLPDFIARRNRLKALRGLAIAPTGLILLVDLSAIPLIAKKPVLL